ncbi:hypothetical protein TYRP_013172 [Tyrophagus putrescentiae]|nr:hypothetical protein TYRP_013172 [Tyrophagus putrescentiae]
MSTTLSSEADEDDHLSSRRLLNPLIAGAVAGLSVDVLLFPVDTIKTRLQSPRGFLLSGGFKRLYAGLGSTVSGSAPVCHLVSACLGETVACLVRVPVEVVKQRAQAYNSNSPAVLRQVLAQSGPKGLYRGYTSTLIREIPFSLVQFPLWEYLKRLKPYQSMACGSAAGAVAAFLTTPLDVAKTTIMLSSAAQQEKRNTESEYRRVLVDIYSRKGVKGLFAGALPRVAWISVGGAIFLGGYDIVSGCL